MTSLGELSHRVQSNHSQSAVLAKWCQLPCPSRLLAMVGLLYAIGLPHSCLTGAFGASMTLNSRSTTA